MPEQRFTPGTIYRAVLLAFGLVVAALIFRALVGLILAVLIVAIVSIPLAVFADLLERRGVPRALGATLGLLLGIAIVGGVIAAIVPVFTQEINKFVAALPGIVDGLRHRLGALTGTSASHIGKQLQHFVNSYTQHPAKLLGPIATVGASVAGVLAAVIVVLLTALYTAINPEPLISGFVRIVVPGQRPAAMHVLGRLRTAYLAWLRGLAIGMVILGVLTYAGLRIVGLPFAAFFAVFTAIAMIVPYFGALASSIPPVLFALTFSPGKAVLVAAIYILVHQLEGNVIQPLIVARTVKLHPALIAVGVIAVEQLFGFVGLTVAVPILATFGILVEELWIAPMEKSRRRALVEEPAPQPQLAYVGEGGDAEG